MNARTHSGFTLIELMIAVAILAIIAAIAVPAYRGYISESRIQTAVQDVRQAELILDDLAMDNDLVALDANNTNLRGLYLQNGQLVLGSPTTTPPGTERWEDPWGRLYLYQRPATRLAPDGNVSNNSTRPQGYDLYSRGPDGSTATDDIVRGCNGEFMGSASGHPTSC